MRTFVRLAMRCQDEFDAVILLLKGGLTDSEIARQTGVPRRTVRQWRARPFRLRRLLPPPPKDWRPLDASAYADLLGLYLGDGHIVAGRGHSAVLRLYLDEDYPMIISSAKEAMTKVVPAVSVRSCKRPGSVSLYASSALWPVAFPQHGPGRKHTRPIELVDWQRELTARHPQALLRGLIHSDGCRCVNRFTIRLPKGGDRQYEYPRYFFTNLSSDIRGIFCAHCELLGIRWTQSNFKSISVSDRRSVATLDSFVGPKE